MSKQQNLRKLWRDIGLTKQKYDKDSSRSPSFDRSSLGKSKQIKSNSSQDISIRKQKIKVIQQIKPKQSVMFSKFCEKIDKLGLDIKSIPEEDDFQTVHNSGFCKKQQNRQKYQACENTSELQLLSFILKKPHQSPNKIYKTQLQVIKQKMRRIKLNYNQIQRLIKYQFNQYRKDIQKNNQTIKGLLDEITKQSQKRKDKNMQLLEQNHKLRSQLIYAYRLIQDLQKHKSQSQKNILLMNPKQQQYCYKQNDKKTVKRDEHRANKKTYSTLHIPNSHQTIDLILQNNENRNSQRHFGYEKFNQSHAQKKEKQSYTNREKFKKYIEEKKKKNEKNLEEFQVKTENLQSPNQIKFSKIVKLSTNENPFLNLANSPNLHNLTEQKFYKKIHPKSQILNQQYTRNIKDIAKNQKHSKKK